MLVGDAGVRRASSLSYWKHESSPQREDIVAAHRKNFYHEEIYIGNNIEVLANVNNVARKNWPNGGDTVILYIGATLGKLHVDEKTAIASGKYIKVELFRM